MNGAIVLCFACAMFLVLQEYPGHTNGPLLPFMGLESDSIALVAGICSGIIYWYFRNKWGGEKASIR